VYMTTDSCTNCKICYTACPTDAIKEVSGKPFSCTTCGVCIEVCPTGALRRGKYQGVLVDRARCTRCGLCVKFCPFGFPKLSDQSAAKGFCARCAVCEKVCPVSARVDLLALAPTVKEKLFALRDPENLRKLVEGGQ
jgi:energy-converting hydrogenase B subunit K